MDSWSPAVVTAVAAAVIVSLALALLWTRGRWRRATRRRQRVARRGERRAERLLRRDGFEVLDRQVQGQWRIRVDGDDETVSMRADLLVRRRRRRYVAEVKTGEVAPDPTYPPTRRQLLEYRLAYDVDGVLLVDVPGGRVLEVEFPEVEFPEV